MTCFWADSGPPVHDRKSERVGVGGLPEASCQALGKPVGNEERPRQREERPRDGERQTSEAVRAEGLIRPSGPQILLPVFLHF